MVWTCLWPLAGSAAGEYTSYYVSTRRVALPDRAPSASPRAGERIVNEPTPDTVVPLPAHLDAVRTRFEAAWRSGVGGTLPRIEDQLGGLAGTERLTLLRE